jgi:hypothetical protein
MINVTHKIVITCGMRQNNGIGKKHASILPKLIILFFVIREMFIHISQYVHMWV